MFKTKEEEQNVSASYEYIGLKLMHIVRLFIRGERFPEGALGKDVHYSYLLQTIHFITKKETIHEFLKLNAKSYFAVVAEVFLNEKVASTLKDLEADGDKDLSLVIPHEMIITKIKNEVGLFEDSTFVRFEYCCFVVSIALSE